MNPLNNQENHSMLHMSTAWEFDPWCCEGLAHKTRYILSMTMWLLPSRAECLLTLTLLRPLPST